MYFLTFRSRLWTLFVVFQSTLSFFKIFDAKILTLFVVFGVLFDNFEVFSSVFFNLQTSTLNAICGVPEHLAILLFVFDVWFWRVSSIAGGTFGSQCFSSMLDLDAISRGRTLFARFQFFSEVDFERYLWCSRALGNFLVCLRSLILTLFVVAGPRLRFFDAWLWRYLSWPEVLLEVQSVIFNMFLMILRLRVQNL